MIPHAVFLVYESFLGWPKDPALLTPTLPLHFICRRTSSYAMIYAVVWSHACHQLTSTPNLTTNPDRPASAYPSSLSLFD